jgi:hypothetical protein
MGTHCYIGIEDKNDGTVCCVYIHYDGYFSYIIPLLRKNYMERSNVEGLIACGDMQSLRLPNEWIVCENEPTTFGDRYIFEMEARQNIEYFYLFNKDDKWEFQSSEMISIDELSC